MGREGKQENGHGSHPDGRIHRLWFDVATNLPVCMEFEFVSESSGPKAVKVTGQFEWSPALPVDSFTPQIPPGFTLAEN